MLTKIYIICTIKITNPICYRGYYYLKSRYYDPSICRFINADIPEIAQQYKEDVNGLNIFAYCCNNPVNYVDYDGYWGADVHFGGNEENDNYTCTSINGRTTAYGTYYWAVQCGFSRSAAKKLGKYCNALDKYNPSTMYSLALSANASNSTIIYNASQLRTYKNWQYYHFNGKKTGKDTREDFADKKLERAVKTWKSGKLNRNDALRLLGYGLHAMQDIEAHGNMGRGDNFPIQVLNADEIDYDWKNSERTRVKKSNGSKTRVLNTRRATYDYLNRFISKIGGVTKLK